jgi:hypothetical protein
MQGSVEGGATPAVSPNTGQLFTVGMLGVARSPARASTIADVNNAAFAAINHDGASAHALLLVDLDSGKANFIRDRGGRVAPRHGHRAVRGDQSSSRRRGSGCGSGGTRTASPSRRETTDPVRDRSSFRRTVER